MRMSTTEDLRRVARRLHVHYDVQPELEALPDGARRRTALVVSLWGVHAKGARALPACAKSREIAARLTAIAEYVLAGDSSGCGERQPARCALYVSRVISGADEVGLTIRIVKRAVVRTASVTAAEERCLALVRARLRQLEVHEV
jgi:hypothetical protein